jgi:hypothetical protein
VPCSLSCLSSLHSQPCAHLLAHLPPPPPARTHTQPTSTQLPLLAADPLASPGCTPVSTHMHAHTQAALDHNQQLMRQLQQQLAEALQQQASLRTSFTQLEAVSETGRAVKAEARWGCVLNIRYRYLCVGPTPRGWGAGHGGRWGPCNAGGKTRARGGTASSSWRRSVRRGGLPRPKQGGAVFVRRGGGHLSIRQGK